MIALSQIEEGTLIGIFSPMHSLEIEKIRNQEKRMLVSLLAKILTEKVVESENVRFRATSLEEIGFHLEDAYHLAFAEEGRCDVFLTTDDRFERLANRYSRIIRTRVINPIDFVMERKSQ